MQYFVLNVYHKNGRKNHEYLDFKKNKKKKLLSNKPLKNQTFTFPKPGKVKQAIDGIRLNEK